MDNSIVPAVEAYALLFHTGEFTYIIIYFDKG
jgi:hypothetical protein